MWDLLISVSFRPAKHRFLIRILIGLKTQQYLLSGGLFIRKKVTLYHTSLCRSFSRFPSEKYSDRCSARLLQTVLPHTCLQENPLPPESDNQCRLYYCRYDDGRSDTVPARKLLRKNQALPAAFRQWPDLLFPVIFRYSFRIFLHTDGYRYRESVLLSPK